MPSWPWRPSSGPCRLQRWCWLRPLRRLRRPSGPWRLQRWCWLRQRWKPQRLPRPHALLLARYRPRPWPSCVSLRRKRTACQSCPRHGRCSPPHGTRPPRRTRRPAARRRSCTPCRPGGRTTGSHTGGSWRRTGTAHRCLCGGLCTTRSPGCASGTWRRALEQGPGSLGQWPVLQSAPAMPLWSLVAPALATFQRRKKHSFPRGWTPLCRSPGPRTVCLGRRTAAQRFSLCWHCPSAKSRAARGPGRRRSLGSRCRPLRAPSSSCRAS